MAFYTVKIEIPNFSVSDGFPTKRRIIDILSEDLRGESGRDHYKEMEEIKVSVDGKDL